MARGDALKALQSKCGVTPDGAFGPNTARAIAAHFKLDAKRGAHFLGQVAHESMNFLISKESLFYSSADRIQKIWPTRFKNVDAAKPYTKNPKKLGNFVYGDRMGNAPNEGHKYLGRGFIQLTGKKNVTEFAHHIGRDSLIDDPKPIEEDTKDPDVQMEEALDGEKFEDVDDQVLEEEYISDDDGVKGPHLLKDNELKELLENAEPEVLEEVAKELDKEPYNPYTDNRDDEELSEEELADRQNRKLYAPDWQNG